MMVKSVSMLLSSFVLIIVLVAGCSHVRSQKAADAAAKSPVSDTQPGASVSTPFQTPASIQLANDTRPLIVAFGDSLTAGYRTGAGESYPDYLQRDLNASGYQYRVLNEGISGNTSKDGVVRVQRIAAMHPAIVIVAFGGNDGLRGIPITDTETNLATIISTLQNEHAEVILGGITLPPNYGSEYIAKFNAMYEKQAHAHHVPLLPFMLKDAYGVPGDMQNDGTHATAKGNQQVARNFLPLLLPLLHKPHAHPPLKTSTPVAANPTQP